MEEKKGGVTLLHKDTYLHVTVEYFSSGLSRIVSARNGSRTDRGEKRNFFPGIAAISLGLHVFLSLLCSILWPTVDFSAKQHELILH